MKTAAQWGLLALLCQHTLVCSHIVDRASNTRDLGQLKSFLHRFEEALAEVAQEEGSDSEYEDTNPTFQNSQATQKESPDPEWEQEPLTSDRTPAGLSKPTGHRSLLQDLLMRARKRASGCFGARMDRIGNASGLGCNSRKG